MQFSANACVFYLADPLTLPSQDYEWLVAVPHATIPLSHWVVDESNNLLELVYSDESRYISLPLGNRSVDEIVVYLNDRLLHGYTAAYDEAINRIVFSSSVLGESLAIGEMSTCGRLLGVKAGDAAVDGVLIPPRGVDLAGTSSIFIRSNLSTRNRDPVSKATSDILVKVHVSQNFNEIEYHTSSLKFPIADRNVSLIIIYLTDDFQRHMDFHGAGIQVDLSEVNDSIAELEAKHDIDTENLEAGLGETQSNVEGLSNAAAAAADALSSLEDDVVALSNFAHECCETAESNIAALSEELAAIDTSSYIPQSEKSRFIVDLVEPFAIGAHADNASRIDVFGTLRSPLGPLFDLGEAANPWREVYAEGLTLSDTSNLKFTHFQGAEGDFNLDDVIVYAAPPDRPDPPDRQELTLPCPGPPDRPDPPDRPELTRPCPAPPDRPDCPDSPDRPELTLPCLAPKAPPDRPDPPDRQELTRPCPGPPDRPDRPGPPACPELTRPFSALKVRLGLAVQKEIKGTPETRRQWANTPR
eukprot:jgi/Tetstr1/457055/TSEL_043718.t1